MATTLILIRHGESSGSIAGCHSQMSGWTDFHLSARGQRQVERLGLAHLGQAPTALYSSPLLRARQTAAALEQPTGLRVRVLEGLKEIHCGQAEGLPFPEAQERFSAHWEQNLRQDNDDFRWPGGESYRELRERSLSTLRQIAQHHPGECVLVVTHCGLVTQVIGFIRGLPPAHWEKFRPGNCSITEVQWSDPPRILRYDDRRHLAGIDPAETFSAR